MKIVTLFNICINRTFFFITLFFVGSFTFSGVMCSKDKDNRSALLLTLLCKYIRFLLLTDGNRCYTSHSSWSFCMILAYPL
jgi:hypothetical protein